MKYSDNNSNENLNNEISLKKYLNIFIEEKILIISLTLIASLVGVTISLIKRPVWRGDFKMVIKENNPQQSSIAGSTISGSQLIDPLAGLKNSVDNKTRLEILKSESVLKPVYDFAKNNDSNLNLSYKNWINKKTRIKYKTGTNVLVVSYTDKNKELILSTLTKIKNSFQEYSISSRKKNLSESINFLNNQKKIISEKYQKSLAEFNKFTIENGLGNIDGFLAIETNNGTNLKKPTMNIPQGNYLLDSKTQERSTMDITQKNYPIALQSQINQTNRAGERYAIQFENLERKEALYNQLSSRLKPNSQTMTKLSEEIKLLTEALKRPNEILIKYRNLQSEARRNQLLFYRVSDNLELSKLEQVKQLKPWEVISPPTIDELRESPKRKQIVITSFLIGLLFSSIIAILNHNKKGIVFEKDDFERYLGLKFDGFLREDINFNTLVIKKYKTELNQEEKIAILKLEEDDSNNIKYFLKDSKIKFINLNKLQELENFQNIVVIACSGKIKIKTLKKVKEYLMIYKNKIKGVLFKTI